MTLEQKIDWIFKHLRAEKNKETWVSVRFIKLLTGWDKEELREARQQGLIEVRRTEEGIRYKLESLNDKFIKHQSVPVEN